MGHDINVANRRTWYVLLQMRAQRPYRFSGSWVYARSSYATGVDTRAKDPV